MRLILSPRQTGKTYKSVMWVREVPGRVLIVPDGEMAKVIRKLYGLTTQQVMTPRTARSRMAGRGVSGICIDNVELCYNGEIPTHIEGVPVQRVTIEGPSRP